MSQPALDAAIHPSVRFGDELREYLPEPWRSRPFPEPQRYAFPAPQGILPGGEWGPREAGELPASNPARVTAHLDSIGASHGVLLPLTRGLLPDLDMNTMVCSATNEWLADSWLGEDPRFRGSIRINPGDPAAAISELERWAGDRRMVQVAVPMESHQPYGKRFYALLWEAVAASGLPVAVHTDGGSGVDFHQTPNGYPGSFAEYSVLTPLNFIYHLTSLIAEGVFERLDGLRFVFTDGGHDLLMPLMWRMDMDWPISRIEVPWVTRLPSEYLADHVRFVAKRLEGPPAADTMSAWWERAEGDRLVLWGSGFPHWTGSAPGDWTDRLDGEERGRLLGANAAEFYGLGAGYAGSPASP